MKLWLLFLLLSIALMHPARGEDASQSSSAIPPANPALYSKVRTFKKWKNPVLKIGDNGIFINDAQTPTPEDKILSTLAKLPPQAWPYGKAVGILAFPGLSSHMDAKAQTAIVEKVLAILKSAGIEADLWPTAYYVWV